MLEAFVWFFAGALLSLFGMRILNTIHLSHREFKRTVLKSLVVMRTTSELTEEAISKIPNVEGHDPTQPTEWELALASLYIWRTLSVSLLLDECRVLGVEAEFTDWESAMKFLKENQLKGKLAA
jgi:hypothetical protein